MMFIKLLKFFLIAIAVFFSGCATLPRETLNIPVYNISGKEYCSLKSLCETKGISWKWDSLGEAVTLNNNDLEAKILLNSSSAEINGKVVEIKSAPIFYQGMVAVPISFREEVIAKLLKIKPIKETAIFCPPAYSLSRVVIDAGHGGYDPGAIGRFGLREKDITLDVSKRVRDVLEEQGIDVIMTRDSDRFISLGRRSEVANASGADLFISIHVNSSRARRIQGFEVYCPRDFNDSAINKLAFSGECDYLFKNLSLDRSSKNVKAILLDMIYTENRSEALTLARCISSSAAKELNLKNRGIKGANFFVLKNTHIPAILIEIGFVSNAAEEKYLRNSFYRQQLAESIASGLTNFQRICKLERIKK